MSDTGNPLQSVPPTDVKVTDVVDHEVDPRKRAQLEALGRKDAGDHNAHWAARAAHITDGAGTAISLLTGLVDSVLTQIVKLLTAAQGEKNSSFYDLAAAALHDLTGVEVDAEALKNTTFNSGRLAGMEKFGGDLYDLLESEFKPESGNLEEGSSDAAKTFLGFLMNFAIRQGNIETILSMIPEEYRLADGARAYGELMAKNLGLGRMARRALQPLIQILVADPLMYKLQEQYRPKRLGPSPAIKKFFRDPNFEQQMRKELAQEGYTDARINDLIDELRPLLSPRELIEHAFRSGTAEVGSGVPGSSEIADQLSQRGYGANDIVRLVGISRPVLDKNEIGVLFTNGVIEHEIASGYLSKLGFDSETGELVLRAHSLTHQHARRLGLAELKRAFHDSVIDLLELKAHLSADGYSDDDIQIVTLDLLQPATGKVRQLSLAEVRAGFKTGVLTEKQASEHLKTLGYSDADIAVIVKTLPGPKAPATAGTPASSPPSTPTAG
jgi:hypothetical protein